MPNKWFTRSKDVLDTSIAGSYVYIEDRSDDGAGYKTGLIVGVVIGAFLGAFILILLYIRRRPNSQVRNWHFPRMDIKVPFKLEKLRKRKSYGIKEMISVTAPTEFSMLQQEQQQLSPVHAYHSNTKSARLSVLSDVDALPEPKLGPELPQKDMAKLPESSWLLISPNNSDEQIDVETAGRPGTARTSRVTIPSYYYHYYRKYFEQDNYRVQSQYNPQSRLSSDLISYRDRSSGISIYQRTGTSTNHERISTLNKPLVPEKGVIDKDASEPSIDQDPRLAYFEFDIHLPNKPKQAILRPPPPPPPPAPAARKSRQSMDTYRSSQQYYSRKKKNRQTASSIATVSTAPIFRQHPGEEVDLESIGRVGRVRSSLLSGLIVR